MDFESELSFEKYRRLLSIAIDSNQLKYAYVLSLLLLRSYPDDLELREQHRISYHGLKPVQLFCDKCLVIYFYPVFCFYYYCHLADAIELAERIINAYPSCLSAQLLLAKSSERFSCQKLRVLSLEKAVSLAPMRISVLIELARAYLDQGNTLKAKELINRVFVLEPENYLALRMEKKLMVYESLSSK